jgi:hypothetical protein
MDCRVLDVVKSVQVKNCQVKNMSSGATRVLLLGYTVRSLISEAAIDRQKLKENGDVYTR